jgi:G3E family GTPase
MPGFFDAQARLSPTFVVNKTDLARDGELATIRDTLHALNPHAAIRTATHGVMHGEIPARAPARAGPAMPDAAPVANTADDGTAPAAGNGHADHHHGKDPAGVLSTWSAQLHGECDPQSLRDVLDAVAHGAFGEVARVKGVARAGAGWVHFDMAGGRASVAAFAPKTNDEPRVVAIGRRVDGDRLQAAFDACATPVVGTC